MIRLLNTIILIAFVAANSFSQKDNLPNYNQRNVDFVKENLRDKKVCCDSIKTIVKELGFYEYLKKIDSNKEKILVGDILQIKKRGHKMIEVVVFEVIDEQHYKIAKACSCKGTLSFYLEDLKIRKRQQKYMSFHRPKHYI